jgi:polyisoprenoid-binding protein YceI
MGCAEPGLLDADTPIGKGCRGSLHKSQTAGPIPSERNDSMKLATRLSGFALAALVALTGVSAQAADKYKVDDTHAFVVFKVDHLGVAPSYGMFRQVAGNIEFDAAAPEKSSVAVTIDSSSVFTANKKRDEHLTGPDFFDAKQFPKIEFKSTAVAKSGDAYKVTGDLTIKGRTKSVTIEMKKTGEGKDPWGNTRIGFEGSISINRIDFGVDFMPDGIGKNVTLMLSLEGIKQ